MSENTCHRILWIKRKTKDRLRIVFFMRVRKIVKSESYLRHVCLSVRLFAWNISGIQWTGFYEIWYMGIFENLSKKNCLKSDKNNGFFIFCWPCIMWWFLVNDQRDAQICHLLRITGSLHADLCTLMISRCISLRMRNVSGKSCRGKGHSMLVTHR